MTPFIEKYIDNIIKNLKLSEANEKELRTDIGNIAGEAYEAGRKVEREACAQLVYDLVPYDVLTKDPNNYIEPTPKSVAVVLRTIVHSAQAIRARV